MDGLERKGRESGAMLGRLGAVSPRWDSHVYRLFRRPQADAEVLVDGGRDEMQVRVENDTVGHVLEALGQNVSLRYRSAAPLNKVIGGSFSGSLEQVLSRVLAGYDFVVRYNMQGVEIFVVGESGAAPTPPPPIEASPQPQTASTVADQDAPSISLAPRFAARKAPSQYDLWTTSRIPKPVALGASFAGRNGAMILRSVDEKLMILGVAAICVALTIRLFSKAH